MLEGKKKREKNEAGSLSTSCPSLSTGQKTFGRMAAEGSVPKSLGGTKFCHPFLIFLQVFFANRLVDFSNGLFEVPRADGQLQFFL